MQGAQGVLNCKEHILVPILLQKQRKVYNHVINIFLVDMGIKDHRYKVCPLSS